MARTRIVIADDNALFRVALSELVDRHDTLAVAGLASTGAEAVRAVATSKPDVALLALGLISHQGLGTVQGILRVSPHTRVFILPARVEPHQVQELLAAGVSCCLPMGTSRDDLLRVLTGPAADGEEAAGPRPQPTEDQPKAVFSRREHEILGFVASAMSNRQIAAALDVTEGTVKRHLHNVFRKLSAVSRIDAVNKAVAAALLPSPIPGTDTDTAVRPRCRP